MQSPSISIAKIIGLSRIASGSGRSMLGTWLAKKPSGPNFIIPATTTVPKVTPARASVTENDAVGEPAQGTIPSRLQPSTKKNSVSSSGTNRSPSCGTARAAAAAMTGHRAVAVLLAVVVAVAHDHDRGHRWPAGRSDRG